MLGLAVLVALGMYVYLATVAVKLVGKHTDSKLARYVTIAVFVLIPTWDILPGRLYFNYLCEKEAGSKVFKTAEIEQAYFLPSGQPNQKKLNDHFDGSLIVDKGFSKLFHIARIQNSIKDKQTGEVLGVEIQFGHYGGWVAAYLFPEGPPNKCAAYSPYRDIWQEVIKQKSVTLDGGN